MSNITTFGGANLPSVQSLSGALRSIQTEVGPTGTVILKMDKTGHWVFGADQTEIEEGSLWAANPFSFVHGYIAWGTGEVPGVNPRSSQRAMKGNSNCPLARSTAGPSEETKF